MPTKCWGVDPDMADFTSAQAQLTSARAAQASAQAEQAQAAQVVKALTIQIGVISRSLDPNDRAGAAQLATLEQQLANAQATLAASATAASSAVAASISALTAFEQFSDPRQSVGQLASTLPFLLLPIRIETRFTTISGQAQLWIRIYPDDCSVDTFESVISVTELQNLKTYWQGIWSAGGVDGDERAAWRGLVAASGSGRAAWLVANYQPTNISAKPTKSAPTDEILVIPTQTELDPTTAAAVSAYWQSVWLANGDKTQLAAAQSALESAVGAAQAATLVQSYVPYNLNDAPTAPLTKTSVALSTSYVVFPPDPPTQQDSWSTAPTVKHLADRFIVLGYTGTTQTLEAIGSPVTLPLYVGPDPTADPSVGIHPEGGDLYVPDQLSWLVDFDQAVAAGMGLKIDLTADQSRNGFDRLLVVGLELSTNEQNATAAFEELLQHHENGRSGLTLVPQGTPTHNTTGAGTGYTILDNADQSYDDLKNAPLFVPTPDPMAKLDGNWVTDLLGIDPSRFQSVHGSDGKDQMQARAMQNALWPATLGYWMDKMLTPVFSDATVAIARALFSQFVSGRGSVPAIRIGGQPYGILPTTAFSRIAWLNPKTIGRGSAGQAEFLSRLYAILRRVDQDWTTMSGQVPHIDATGDAQSLLLGIIGHYPSSVEFYSRYSESLAELFNIANFWSLGPSLFQALEALSLDASAEALLSSLGYTGPTPDIFNHFFVKEAAQISVVIDDVPLSETAAIRSYTDDNRNYIQWLIDAAKTSLDAVYQEQGFTANQTPQAILYLYLRHAIMLGYYDSSYLLHQAAGFLNETELQAMKPEPNFVHVATSGASESRFAALYKTESRITGNATQLVSDYITQNLGSLSQTSDLNTRLQCLAILADSSTASLERGFAEHIDCCTYRYDAWLLGLVNFQLQAMRGLNAESQEPPTQGLYLGAYGWVENLKPSTATLSTAQIPRDIAASFPGTSPILEDATNGGYIHAPSMPHAETAAVLRSGYLANATSANPSTLAVNLSSDRVRLALSVLEGIRGGQSLGELLGYQFERGLHDNFGLAEVDSFIYPMRKAFPLVADQISTTQTAPDVPIEAIEASNVMDGLKLVTQARTAGNGNYPFGVTTLPAASTPEAAAIDSQANSLLDIYDAIADLALAEGVHQAVQGNFDRIAGTMEAYTTGNFPPEPQVVQTPPTGIGLTHRVGIHFQSGVVPPANATPRAQAEPALNQWLSTVLPPLADIQCIVGWTDENGTAQSQTVTLNDLAVMLIDVLELLKPDDLQSMTELDDRILKFVTDTRNPRPDLTLTIQYLSSDPGKIPIFQALALIRCLKALVIRSRSLQATDTILQNQASTQDDGSVSAASTRISTPLADLNTLGTDIDSFVSTVSALTTPVPPNEAAIVAGIDGFLDSAVALLERCSRFNLGLSGWGFAYAWRQGAFAAIFAQVSGLIARWTQKLSDYDAKIAAYDALPAATSDGDRFTALQSAALVISVVLDPLPALPATLRTALDGKRAAFVARLGQFQAVLTLSTSSFSALLTAVQAIPVADLDSLPFDLSSYGESAVTFAEDLVSNLTGHRADITTRTANVQAQIDAYNSAGLATDQVAAIVAGAKALLGPDFQIFPEYTLSATQGAEWENAVSASNAGSLTDYLINTANVDFPVDEWLYGVARIRPNMGSYEQLLMLTGAFGVTSPTLTPIQFPYEATASWMALQIPSTYTPDSERLLYTASYATAFDKSVPQCGLLIDEWTEVIPGPTRDTGIAFNFDRPDNEAPQTFLLVTPASATGQWVWDDLVGALNETLDLAKKRGVEPAQTDLTQYSALLPATIMAATYYGISITTSLAASNGVFKYLEANPNG